MSNRQAKKSFCNCLDFNGDHFEADFSDLDENGKCSFCEQEFDEKGVPIDKYASEALLSFESDFHPSDSFYERPKTEY